MKLLISVEIPFQIDVCLLIILSDEWTNFLERIDRLDSSAEDIVESPSHILELRFWASYRGQTLARTGSWAINILQHLVFTNYH